MGADRTTPATSASAKPTVPASPAEKGITIIRHMHRTIADDATGEPIKVLTGFTTATVFDVSQTEGIPLPPGPTPEDLPQSEAERISRRLRRTLSDPLLLAEECYEPALGRLIDWPPPLHATR